VKLAGVRAVLFDLDGTLADTAPDLARALNRVRAEQGLAPLPSAIARPHTSSGARGLLKAGFDIAPEDEGYRALRDRFLDFYEKELCVETRLFDGIPELLVKIRARKLTWGIVTNKGRRFTEPLLRLLAASLLSQPPADCLYIGDDLRDAQAARAAGMHFAAAGWGYHGEGGDPDTWDADAVMSHPREILDLLS